MSEVPKLDALVKETFASIGDYIEITPLFGRKREIKLNRTLIELCSVQDELKVEPCRIELPQIKSEQESHHTLTLEETNLWHVYFLRSKYDHFFKVNGSTTNFVVLRRGDEISIGMNKIKVLKRHLDTSPAEDFDIHPELNVLIEGETGTGKTHLAKQLHEESQQIGNFIHLNLSAYSSGTLESELFGHCKGAFTGAVSDKDGAFKLANKGTLFLDEIDSISIELQTKLLLFLDNGFYYPVGSNTPQKIKTRLIVASGRSLEQLVRKERMRRDFYFRISSEEVIYLKPLRESSDRMKQLIADFEKKDFVTIHPKLQEMYMRYEWPGNIRQFVSHLKKKKLKSRS